MSDSKWRLIYCRCVGLEAASQGQDARFLFPCCCIGVHSILHWFSGSEVCGWCLFLSVVSVVLVHSYKCSVRTTLHKANHAVSRRLKVKLRFGDLTDVYLPSPPGGGRRLTNGRS